MGRLNFDPLNIVICGIGGQGNVLASELVSSTMNDLGYKVAVGETYGAAQRGGSVMSHVRVSESFEMGVLIPRGRRTLSSDLSRWRHSGRQDCMPGPRPGSSTIPGRYIPRVSCRGGRCIRI